MTEIEQLIQSGDPEERLKAVELLKEKPFDTIQNFLADLLGDEDWRVRKASAEALSRFDSGEVIGILIDSLYDDENAGKRNIAMETLHRMGQLALGPILLELNKTQVYDVRLSLVTLLGDIKNEQAYEHLLYILQTEEDINILSAAVSSLGHYRKFTSIPHLLRCLRKDNPWLQFHCIEALGQIGAPEALQSILPYYEKPGLQKSVLDAIGQISHISSVPFLIKIIRNERPLNLSAVRALMQIYHASLPVILKRSYVEFIIKKVRENFPSEVIHDLLTVVKSTPKEDVRRDLLKLIGWSQSRDGLPILGEYSRHPDYADTVTQSLIDFGPDAWEIVAAILDPMEDEELISSGLKIVESWREECAINHILRLLDHEDDRIVQNAIEVMSIWNKKDFIPYLLSALSHDSQAVQRTAVRVVVALGVAEDETKESILAYIKDLLNNQDINLRIHALNIYVQLEGQGFQEFLVTAVGHENAVIRQHAVQMMSRYDDTRFRQLTLSCLADENPTVRLEAIEALGEHLEEKAFPALLSALDDPDIWIRSAAAKVIGRYEDVQALSQLLRHLTADPPPVKVAVLEALGHIKDSRSFAAINQQLKSSDQEVQRAALLALGSINTDEAKSTLKEHISNEDWRLRATAVQAIGNTMDEVYLPDLHRILKEDQDNFVKEAALQGIGAFHRKESFPLLFWAMNQVELVDEACTIFIEYGDVYRDQLQQTWQNCDKRQEEIISIVLDAIRIKLNDAE